MDKPVAPMTRAAEQKKSIRRKPLTIYVISTLYFLAPCLTVLQTHLYSRPFNTHDIVMMLLYPVVGWGVLRMKKWGWYLVVTHIITLLINNAILALAFNDIDLTLLGQLSTILVLALAFFLQKQVRLPYQNPALRYWERQAPRYDTHFDCRLSAPGVIENPIDTSAINISAGGIFVMLPKESQLDVGAAIVVEIDHRGAQLQLQGRIAWKNESAEDCPRGIGVQFDHLNPVSRRGLNQLIGQLKTEWRAAR